MYENLTIRLVIGCSLHSALAPRVSTPCKQYSLLALGNGIVLFLRQRDQQDLSYTEALGPLEVSLLTQHAIVQATHILIFAMSLVLLSS